MTDYADAVQAASALNDPHLPAADLQAIAAAQPGLHAAVAAHPAAYPDLLTWLDRVGDAPVKTAVAARTASPTTEPGPTAPEPAAGLGPDSAAPEPVGLGSATVAPAGAPTYWLAPGQAGPAVAPPSEPATAPLAWPAPGPAAAARPGPTTWPAPVSAAPPPSAVTTAPQNTPAAPPPSAVTTPPQNTPAAPAPTATATTVPFPAPPAVAPQPGAPDARYRPYGGFQATPADPWPGATPADPWRGPTPADPWPDATPLVPYTGGLPAAPGPRPGRRRRAVAVGLAAGVLAIGGAVGGVLLVRDQGGLISAVAGPPTLTSQQFQALAQETLPDQSGRRPLTVHAPGGLRDDLLTQFCPGDTSRLQGATLEAGSLIGLRLKLFDDANAATDYLDTLSSCMVQTGNGFISTEKTTTDAVTLLTVNVMGVESESFAAYGNVVASGLLTPDWTGFATGQFKPAVDEARTR